MAPGLAEDRPAEPNDAGMGRGPRSPTVGGLGPWTGAPAAPPQRHADAELCPHPRGRGSSHGRDGAAGGVRGRGRPPPGSSGPAEARCPQAAGFGNDIFTVPRVLCYQGGRGEFVCLRRRQEEAEEPLGHKLPFPSHPPPFSLSPKSVKLKKRTAYVSSEVGNRECWSFVSGITVFVF